VTTPTASAAERAAFVLASTPAPSGGWAVVCHKQPSDPLTDRDIDTIVTYVVTQMTALPWWSVAGMMIPGLGAYITYEQSQTINSIKRNLQPYIGQPIGSIPNDLGQVPGVIADIPGASGNPLDVLGGWVQPLLSGLSDIGFKAIFLIVILVALLMGLRQVLESRT